MRGTGDVSVHGLHMYVYMYVHDVNMTLRNLLFITFRAVAEL